MTIIAVTKDFIAADTISWRGDLVDGPFKKIRDVKIRGNKDGEYRLQMAGAGSTGQIQRFMDIMETGYGYVEALVQQKLEGKKLELTDWMREELRQSITDTLFDFVVRIKTPSCTEAFYIGRSLYPLHIDKTAFYGNSDAVLLATGAHAAGASVEEAMRIGMTMTGISAGCMDIDIVR